MAKDDVVLPDGSLPQKPSLGQKLLAMLLGMLAVKLATVAVTTAWRLATREDPPQVDMDDVSAAKKAAWVALVGAAAGAARQIARDKVKPPVRGAA